MRNPDIFNYSGTKSRAGPGGTPIQAEALAYFGRMSTAPSADFQEKVNRAIYKWKAAGAWSQIIALYMHAAETQQAALLCMNTTGIDATLSSTPTFTANKGFSALSATAIVNYGVTAALIASDNAVSFVAGVLNPANTGNFFVSSATGGHRVGAWLSSSAGTGLGGVTTQNCDSYGARYISATTTSPAFCVTQKANTFETFEPGRRSVGSTTPNTGARVSDYRTMAVASHPATRITAFGFLSSATTTAEAQSFTDTLGALLTELGALS